VQGLYYYKISIFILTRFEPRPSKLLTTKLYIYHCLFVLKVTVIALGIADSIVIVAVVVSATEIGIATERRPWIDLVV